MDMNHLKSLLATSGASLVLYDGEVHTYHGRGVADLYDLYAHHPGKLRGALVADKVIGKGAAALMAAGGVARVWTALISRPALQLLLDAGIPTDYDTLVPQILNRTRQGFCPVETLCMDARTPQECLPKIRAFIEQQSR